MDGCSTPSVREHDWPCHVIFIDTHATLLVLAKIAALILWGVLVFWTGAILSKGE